MLITWNTVASSVGTAGTSCQMHWCHITAVSQNKNLISWIRLLLYRSSGVFTQVQREREKKKIYSLNKCHTAYCISIIIVCTHKKKLTFWYFPGFIISWSLLKNGKHQILKRDLVGEGENVCVFFSCLPRQLGSWDFEYKFSTNPAHLGNIPSGISSCKNSELSKHITQTAY